MSSFTNPLQSIAALARLPRPTDGYDVREFELGTLEEKTILGYTLLFLSLITVCLAVSGKPLRALSHSRLPPGPRGLPLIGNVLWFLEARKDPSKFSRFVSVAKP